MSTDLIGQTLGQYQIIERISEGGAAVVYRAHQPSMERDVAVKVLKVALQEQDPAFVERFTLEARTVAQLQHPHILPVLDFGKAGDVVYLVMMLLEGGTLGTLIKEQGALPLDDCAYMITQIASALDRAHSRKIIHRDLKPDNILMDMDHNCYLTDFGLARILESARRLTQAGLLMGTPHYLSPEQARGEAIDTRSDIYALGVMLYEMVTGRLPFEADTAYGIIFKHISETPPAPSTIRADVPDAIAAVLLKALAKEPGDRHQTALQLAEAFVGALPKAPVISAKAEQRAVAQPAGVRDAPNQPGLTGIMEPSRPATPTPTRLTPQRMADDNKITIGRRANDPIAHVPMVNGFMHYAVRALEEVAGLQVMEIILRFAGLENLMDDYPPNNTRFDRGYTFSQYADLNHAIVNYYGAAGKDAVTHIGRLSARWMIMDQPLFGFTSAALRIMPTAAALRLSLNKTADGYNKMWGAAGVDLGLHLIEKPDFFLWAGQSCPCCAGKTSNQPICWIFEAGFIEGGMLIKKKLFPVTQIAARSMGDPLCVWRIGKTPVD